MHNRTFLKCALFALVLCAAAVQATPPTAASKLEQIFTHDMLGSDVAYLQQFTGIPKETYENEFANFRVYKVGQCTVRAYTSDKKVTSLELKVSPNCTFALEKMVGGVQGNVWVHQLTYGKAQGILGECIRFSSDCLWCDSDATPVVYATWMKPNVKPEGDNFVFVRLNTEVVDKRAVDATDKWEKYMIAKEGESYVVDARFSEDNKYDAFAARLFRDVPITSIRIGISPD